MDILDHGFAGNDALLGQNLRHQPWRKLIR